MKDGRDPGCSGKTIGINDGKIMSTKRRCRTYDLKVFKKYRIHRFVRVKYCLDLQVLLIIAPFPLSN